jgi:predicted dehydrogenase
MEQYTEPKKIICSESFGGLSSVTVAGGNFGMAMNGTHYFEMFRYLTDEKPQEVTAWFSDEKVPNPRGPRFEDRAGSVRITTARGKRFYMDISADQGSGVKVIYSGRYGQLVVDELKGEMFLSVRNEEERNLPTTRYGSASLETVKKIQPADAITPTKSVLNALIHEDNYPTGEDGRLAVATLVAAYCSNEQGHKPVIIDEENLPVNREFPWA